MRLKTAAAVAVFAACAVGGVPALAGADPTTPADPTAPTVQADPAAPVTTVPPVVPLAPADPTVQAGPATPAAPIAPPAPDTAVPAAADTPAESTPPTAAGSPSAPLTSIDADGIYAVGTQLVPGVYSTAGPVDNGTCYWKRAGNPDGATIDNALTKKPQTVQIAPTDQAFKTNGCQPWHLTDAAAPAASQGMSPALAGVQLKLYMAQLQARAAASGQPPSP